MSCVAESSTCHALALLFRALMFLLHAHAAHLCSCCAFDDITGTALIVVRCREQQEPEWTPGGEGNDGGHAEGEDGVMDSGLGAWQASHRPHLRLRVR